MNQQWIFPLAKQGRISLSDLWSHGVLCTNPLKLFQICSFTDLENASNVRPHWRSYVNPCLVRLIKVSDYFFKKKLNDAHVYLLTQLITDKANWTVVFSIYSNCTIINSYLIVMPCIKKKERDNTWENFPSLWSILHNCILLIKLK